MTDLKSSTRVPSTARGPRPRQGTAGVEEPNTDPEASEEEPAKFGRPGRRFSRTTPFFIGLTGALGVAVAYLFVRSIADVAQVLTIIGIALFLGVGLQPAVLWLERHRLSRPIAVGLITFCFLAVIGAFVAAAIPPITHEAHELMANFPRYRRNIAEGRGLLGHIVTKLHLASYVRGNSTASKTLKKEAVGGVIGAGKLLLSTTAAAVTIVVLTIYFLIALPSVSELWLGPRPRQQAREGRPFDRGGLRACRRLRARQPHHLCRRRRGHDGLADDLRRYLTRSLLGLFVAIVDLIPVVGSTVGGIVVSLVALTKGLPVAIATAGFYVFYRLFEDYLLVPRVMNRTVQISPGLTIMATLLGAALWGLLGALVAIPIAAGVRLVLEEVVFPATDRL